MAGTLDGVRRLWAVLGSALLAGVAGLIVVGVVVVVRLAMADTRRTFAGQFDGWHHGTMTLVDCFPYTTDDGKQGWRCSGSFVSDDSTIRIRTLSASFERKPGPAATGWVLGAESASLWPPASFGPDQSSTVGTVLGVAAGGLALPVVVLLGVAAGRVWVAARPRG